jgi:two-component system OmpR family response regulator
MSEPDPSVLLVEDDETLRRILVRHLSAHGYRVEEAASAEDAERLLADGVRPHAVILDINLPGATGWALLRGPGLGRVGSPPVMIASALTISPRRLAEFGVAGYLPKPFALETFMDTLERLLHQENVPWRR